METEAVGQDQTPVVEAPIEGTPDAGAENSQGDSGDGHPAWAPIKEALGDILFHKIKPNLQEFDAQAQKRVTETNSKYEAWKQFDAEKVSPAAVTRALGIVRGIDENPREMYDILRAHLLQQGIKLEDVVAPANPEQPGEEEDPRDVALRELQEQQEQVRQFLQAQEQQARQAQFDRQADEAYNTEITALRQARPEMSKEDEQEILQRYALELRAGNYDTSLAKVAQEVDAIRNRILSKPRPNDFAPRIPGSGGTAPTGNPGQKNVAEYTREESQALFAARIKADLAGRS